MKTCHAESQRGRGAEVGKYPREAAEARSRLVLFVLSVLCVLPISSSVPPRLCMPPK